LKQLIFIHGINNQDKKQDEIESTWLTALQNTPAEGSSGWLNDIRIQTAYYADVLFKAEQEWDETSSAVSPMSSISPEEDFASDEIASLYFELQRKCGLSDETVRTYLKPVERDQPVSPMGRGIHKSWLKAIARAIEDIVPCAGRGLATVFLRQAAAYLYKPGLYEQVNMLVQQQVIDKCDDLSETVVIAHSLGSVIGYVTLRQLFTAKKIPLFVTLGSPLGINIIKRRISPPYISPSSTKKWVNGSDPNDFVALHPALTPQTFGPASVENIAELNNGYDDPHDIVKYLSQPVIIQEIKRALV